MQSLKDDLVRKAALEYLEKRKFMHEEAEAELRRVIHKMHLAKKADRYDDGKKHELSDFREKHKAEEREYCELKRKVEEMVVAEAFDEKELQETLQHSHGKFREQHGRFGKEDWESMVTVSLRNQIKLELGELKKKQEERSDAVKEMEAVENGIQKQMKTNLELGVPEEISDDGNKQVLDIFNKKVSLLNSSDAGILRNEYTRITKNIWDLYSKYERYVKAMKAIKKIFEDMKDVSIENFEKNGNELRLSLQNQVTVLEELKFVSGNKDFEEGAKRISRAFDELYETFKGTKTTEAKLEVYKGKITHQDPEIRHIAEILMADPKVKDADQEKVAIAEKRATLSQSTVKKQKVMSSKKELRSVAEPSETSDVPKKSNPQIVSETKKRMHAVENDLQKLMKTNLELDVPKLIPEDRRIAVRRIYEEITTPQNLNNDDIKELSAEYLSIWNHTGQLYSKYDSYVKAMDAIKNIFAGMSDVSIEDFEEDGRELRQSLLEQVAVLEKLNFASGNKLFEEKAKRISLAFDDLYKTFKSQETTEVKFEEYKRKIAHSEPEIRHTAEILMENLDIKDAALLVIAEKRTNEVLESIAKYVKEVERNPKSDKDHKKEILDLAETTTEMIDNLGLDVKISKGYKKRIQDGVDKANAELDKIKSERATSLPSTEKGAPLTVEKETDVPHNKEPSLQVKKNKYTDLFVAWVQNSSNSVPPKDATSDVKKYNLYKLQVKSLYALYTTLVDSQYKYTTIVDDTLRFYFGFEKKGQKGPNKSVVLFPIDPKSGDKDLIIAAIKKLTDVEDTSLHKSLLDALEKANTLEATEFAMYLLAHLLLVFYFTQKGFQFQTGEEKDETMTLLVPIPEASVGDVSTTIELVVAVWKDQFGT